jgi:predicted ArsR family transcriptional regulator
MPGRPKDVSDEEILEAIRKTFGPATAGDIKEQVDLNRSGVNKRLDDLVEKGWVHDKKVGANAVVYWLSDAGKKHLQSTSED